MSKRILVIGAVPHPDDLKSYGGCTTLMQNFVSFCRQRGYRICHVETLRYKNRLLNMAYFAMKFLWGLTTCRVVMYNVSYNGAFTLFPMTAPLAYALKRKVVMRRFGGYFIKQIEEMPPGKRLRMVRLLNKADLIYFETQAMLDEAPKLFAHPERIHWFPNCRKPSVVKKQETGYHKRFVFISHLRVDKGVDLLLHVADTLPQDYTVHIYGSVYDKKYADPHYFDGHRAEYCGALRTEEVLPTLAQYDVLVLPSYCATEGYPGIIIEAMSLGVPAIATRHGGIPELITDGENGLLISIRDEEALRKAMLSVNSDNYEAMSAKALRRFNERYNSDVVNQQVWDEMKEL